MKDKIGVIVDGQGDFASIKARFNGVLKIVKTDGPRGHCASVSQIVAGSKKQIRILKGFGCNKIISLVDYECRSIGCDNFVKDLNEAFQREYDKCIVACSPNRMIENWYLADIFYLSKRKNFLKSQTRQKKYEGCDGKEEVKKIMVSGEKYNEIKHGSELFKDMRFNEARKISVSLHKFLDLLGINPG